jgi:hypothetical protein
MNLFKSSLVIEGFKFKGFKYPFDLLTSLFLYHLDLLIDLIKDGAKKISYNLIKKFLILFRFITKI